MYKNFSDSLNLAENSDKKRLTEIKNESNDVLYQNLGESKIKIANHSLINDIHDSDFNLCGEVIIKGLIKDISDDEQ